MAQKIIKIGKSTGITIPKDMLERFGIEAGDTVEIEADEKRGGFFVKAGKRHAAVDRELVDWADDFIESYRPALEALAKK